MRDSASAAAARAVASAGVKLTAMIASNAAPTAVASAALAVPLADVVTVASRAAPVAVASAALPTMADVVSFAERGLL